MNIISTKGINKRTEDLVRKITALYIAKVDKNLNVDIVLIGEDKLTNKLREIFTKLHLEDSMESFFKCKDSEIKTYGQILYKWKDNDLERDVVIIYWNRILEFARIRGSVKTANAELIFNLIHEFTHSKQNHLYGAFALHEFGYYKCWTEREANYGAYKFMTKYDSQIKEFCDYGSWKARKFTRPYIAKLSQKFIVFWKYMIVYKIECLQESLQNKLDNKINKELNREIEYK